MYDDNFTRKVKINKETLRKEMLRSLQKTKPPQPHGDGARKTEITVKPSEENKKNLKTIDEHNKKIIKEYEEYKNKHQKTGVECPKCGSELLFVNEDIVLMTYPPKKYVYCSKCGYDSAILVSLLDS